MVMKSPAVIIIPSLLEEASSKTESPDALAPDFAPIHPLAEKLRHVLRAPETSTIGDMAELVEQLMGELWIMGAGLSGLPPPPQPMSPPIPGYAAAGADDGELSDEDKMELGRQLLSHMA